jgi:hypothetical protein
MGDAYRAVRQFERLMGKSHEQLMQETNSQTPEPDGRVIATIIYTRQYDNPGNLRDITEIVQRAEECL